MQQEVQRCELALSAAESRLSKAQPSDAAAELGSPTHLPRLAGSCYLFLGDARRAERFLQDTMRQAGRSTKAAAVAAANLALAHTRQTKVDEAVGTLHQAIDIIEHNRGGGGMNIAFAAGRALSRWQGQPAVRDVQDRLLALMTS